MHLEDEVTFLKTVDPPYKICHNIQCVHLPIHNDETYFHGQLGNIAQRFES